MIQLFPRCAHLAGFGASTSYVCPIAGAGSFPSNVGFPTNAKAPVALDSTFRNLTLLLPEVYPADVTLTLLVDGVASTQAVTVAAGDLLGVSAGADVVVTAGQDIAIQYSGYAGTGKNLSYCLERDGVGNIFGLYPNSGTIAVDVGSYGGALGNGIVEQFEDAIAGDSNSYSICAVDGTITTLVCRAYSGEPGAGIWTGALRVDGLLQDGTGGTVDTRCVLTGTTTVNTSTFSLPITRGQHVDVCVIRTGVSAPYALQHVALGVGVTPSVADAFMLCGGSNDVVPNDAVSWRWPGAVQDPADLANGVAPISPAGLTVLGLYVERSDPATGGYTHTILRSGAATTAVVTILSPAETGVIADLSEAFVSGQTLTLESTPVGEPIATPPHWGCLATSAVVVPPIEPEPEPPSAPTYLTRTEPVRRLRRAPHLTEEQRWLFYHRFQLDLESGMGLVTGQGEDPQVMVRWSNDSGHTWSNEHWVSAGRLGEYRRRVLVRQGGRARDRVYEVVVSDRVRWHLVAAWLDVDEGTH